ncbi:Rrf2 family transcriptional regulator [Serratia odorifera]|uniref:Transcriptional regulator, Rrf2 family n=2 Tax=Serratia odorifera TaxID=618 RepID=D4E677_SEROD|nr:Rrf2 family transcriptional regulator [Serratia odorifera]EFE94806.1 transcriptional regulator, Rrf2 family [Serratia odorifera DSM 4582]MBJ2064838.1 Rrf2 family transcriptional regulator [Serratia odorifera]PNK89492.1 Rrf2 family transcriptional regulator [Serratia odorifera]RII70922.1 Rrf2 family transcriptional regulator [Serratia odorifera]VDZ63175.1 Putative HTH-type transcriptional regulator ywnA [Serratia odorifera]
MSTSTRFAVAIHILTNITLFRGQAVRSEDIARSVNTNPTVVRRILGALADAGLTHSQMGQGGGALLAKPASEITLRDIYHAVEDQPYFPLHRSKPNDECYIGHAIIPVLEGEFARISRHMEASLAQTSLADIVGKVEACAGYPFEPCECINQPDTHH